ncbi:hypothetical protein KTD31_01300 [Burkholderia multivorans]|uniref:hypothetical protein n=1 Tax=Burkholderia multivorans TaxID=87883 RepID=UPI001C250EE3|nr:hypothetical protein [Burkholderia multivorans]MBU9200038.1 hypothetical protein [Burkholderia multivorans]MDN8078843.1 hypothetical protein [Burkholderia multivorans]
MTTTNEYLTLALEARGITPHDLEDTVHALLQDKHAEALARIQDEAGKAILIRAIAMEAKTLTGAGLYSQVAWMDCYYNNRDNLEWALAGFLNLPLAA